MSNDPLVRLHNKVKRIMLAELQDNPEANLTMLAEEAAISVDHDEWLDDPDHWIFDLAVEVAGDDV